MTLRIYDSAVRELRVFSPLHEGRASIYVCGLTVQSAPHVGHVRSAVNFDVVRRWLHARGYAVDFIRNITDIDDKILAKAAEQDRPWYNLAYEVAHELSWAYDTLGVLRPTYEPLATAHIPEMVGLIEELIDRGHAYAATDESGDVFFDVASFAEYGSLSGQRVEDMEAAADADPRGKRDPRDFALWKGAKAGEPETAAWASPWGKGRPGWHIECSAMATKYLGNAFDIHGGGLDLRFPHHENEQAQARAAGRDFAQYWMHNAWITTSGEKMSKSLGNSLTIQNVLNHVRAIELRYYVVAAHYRSHVEFSFEALTEAAAAFARIEGFLERAGMPEVPTSSGALLELLPEQFVAAMDEDFGTPAAVGVIHDAVRAGNKALADGDAAGAHAAAGRVRAMLSTLGLDPGDEQWTAAASSDSSAAVEVIGALVAGMLAQRAEARANKDFAAADAIRDQIKAAGIELEDTPDGPKWSI